MDLETDPIRSGYVRAFGRPGGNVTGLFLDRPLIAGKWLEILKEALPSIERVALVWDPNSGTDQLRAAQDAARAIGVTQLLFSRSGRRMATISRSRASMRTMAQESCNSELPH